MFKQKVNRKHANIMEQMCVRLNFATLKAKLPLSAWRCSCSDWLILARREICQYPVIIPNKWKGIKNNNISLRSNWNEQKKRVSFILMWVRLTS